MKIKFLGTSAGWPLPRLGCYCRICVSKNPKDIRTRSQAIVNETLLLDVGPDTYQHLNNQRVDTNKIEYAAITHEHPDHTLGLWDLSHIYSGKGRKKVKVIVNKTTLSKIRFMFFPREYEIVEAESFQDIKLDKLKVQLLPVNHTKESSFGILVKEGSKSFFWAPDFKSLPPKTVKSLKGVTMIAIDGSELKIKTPGHQSINEGIGLSKQLSSKVFFTHLGHRTLPHKELEEYVKKEGGQNFFVSFDNLEIEI